MSTTAFGTGFIKNLVSGPSGKYINPGPPKYVKYGPKPLKTAQKAMILHTSGVEDDISCVA